MRPAWPAALLALLAAGGGGPSSAAAGGPTRPAGPSPSLGTNLQGVADYQHQPFFADLVKQGRPWFTGPSVSHLLGPEQLTADGWPTVDASILVLAGGPFGGVAGPYALSFDGPAGVEVAVSGTGVTLGPLTRGAGGRYAGTLTATAATEGITLSFSGTQGRLRDVRLLRPGHGPGELFSRDLLARLARFEAVRFMQFMGPPSMGVNGNTERTWAQRTRPGHAFQVAGQNGDPWILGPPTATSNRSPAWEYVILLCNQTGKDAWITVPFLVDDDYLARLARLFRYGSDGVEPYAAPQAAPVYPPLAAHLKLYVEFSNELWNGGYATTALNENLVPMPWEAGATYRIAYSRTGARVRDADGGVWELTAVDGQESGVSGRSGSTPPAGTGVSAGADGLTWTRRGTLSTLADWERGPHLDYLPGSRQQQAYRRNGWSVLRLSRAFRRVFGDAAMMTRVRPVLAGQLGNFATIDEPLAYLQAVWGGEPGKVNAFGNTGRPLSYWLYGISGAPYVPGGNDALDTSSADTLLDGASAYLTAYTFPFVERLAAVARRHGLMALAYEGGQNFIPERMPPGVALGTRVALGLEAQRSPRMRTDLYEPLLRHWAATPGTGLFMHYTLCTSWGPGGFWGLSDDITSEATPKWDAIKNVGAGR